MANVCLASTKSSIHVCDARRFNASSKYGVYRFRSTWNLDYSGKRNKEIECQECHVECLYQSTLISWPKLPHRSRIQHHVDAVSISTGIITQIDKKMKTLLSCSSPSPACNKFKWMINFVLNNWCIWSQFVDFGVRKSFDIAQELERRDLMDINDSTYI